MSSLGREFCYYHQVLREAGQPCPRCATEDRLTFDARLADLTSDHAVLRTRVGGMEYRLQVIEAQLRAISQLLTIPEHL